jgi:undecaprenol kinase
LGGGPGKHVNDLKNLSFATRLRFAFAGLGHAIRSERSVRTQLFFLLAVLAALAYWRPPAVWWALVLLISSAVIAAELFNTAIERLADQLQSEPHPQIRIVKDCAAAAVLVLSAGALCVAAALALSLWNAR